MTNWYTLYSISSWGCSLSATASEWPHNLEVELMVVQWALAAGQFENHSHHQSTSLLLVRPLLPFGCMIVQKSKCLITDATVAVEETDHGLLSYFPTFLGPL